MQQAIFFLAEHNPSFMKKCDIVCNLVEVTYDMGRNQNGTLFLLNKIQKDIQNFIPDDRVQTTGSFVENQQLSVMGKRNRHACLLYTSPV